MKTALKIISSEPSAETLDRLGYDIISIAWLDEATAKKSPRDILNYYKILVMLKGQATIHIGKNKYFTKGGDCVLFAPGSLYHAEISDDNGCQFGAINFRLNSPVDEKQFQQLMGIEDVAIFQQLASASVTVSMVNIFENCFAENEGHYMQVLLLLKRLIGTIFYLGHPVNAETEEKKSRNSEENVVMMCHRYLIANPAAAVTVEELCSVFNLSQSYLYKCFSNVLGISTKQFITDTKLDMAAKLLIQTDKSIADIATDTGFNNGYQFSNVFKKKYNISPSVYRKNNR